jgi:cation diffusion facilitator CzcD-associated flavoprotein CzcO
MEHWDAIIIGAGMGGLCAAARLTACAPQIFDPGRTDPVSGPSPSCGMIAA